MKILLCVDGSNESAKALDKTIEIVSGCRIDRVAVLNVFEKVSFPMMTEGSHDFDPEIMESYQQMNDELLKEHELILEQAAAKLMEKGIEPERILKEGHPAHTIAEVAETQGFDLIILGSRGQSGLKKALLGSVSNTVLQETNTSVLVVK